MCFLWVVKPTFAPLGVFPASSGKGVVLFSTTSPLALSAAIEFRAEVMLLDVDMPGKSGGDLASEAAGDSRLRDVPILFLTGLLSHEDTGPGPIESGGQQFLAKPVDPEQLLACMESLFPRAVMA